MIVRPRCGPSSSSGFSFNDHFCDDPFDAGDDPTDDDPAGDDPTDDPAADDDGDHNCYYDYYDSWWFMILDSQSHFLLHSWHISFNHQAGPDQPCGEEDSGNLGANQGSVQWLQAEVYKRVLSDRLYIYHNTL